MPVQNVFLGKTINRSPLKLMMGDRPVADQAKPVTVNFEDDQKALLDLSNPLAANWAKMIDYLQKNNRPVYLETDAGTGIITRLCAPEAARVWEIDTTNKEFVYVSFHTSDALHFLSRDHPGFQTILDALQAAMDKSSVILVTSTYHDFEIIDVRSLPSSFGNEEPPGSLPSPETPTIPAPSKTVSLDRATELLNMIIKKSCTPCVSTASCIPFRWPSNGCWIRAHLMCYLLISKGAMPEKIWSDGKKLRGRSTNVPGCIVKWTWHVAATLMVMQGDGVPVKMVIDPSLSYELLTPEKWRSLQTDPDATLKFSSWEQYEHYSGTADQAMADNDMEKFRIDLDQLCKEFGPSPYKCPEIGPV
ncbi:MAG TPA: protein-glutamine glutaminase family protein [Chitinophagaceae bacterium]|nr:protein-glutamine glutaminase family protein [Chitinophagaceae bacterium]